MIKRLYELFFYGGWCVLAIITTIPELLLYAIYWIITGNKPPDLLGTKLCCKLGLLDNKQMGALTSEQKQYIDLVKADEKMMELYLRLDDENKFPGCMPRALDDHYCQTYHEQLFYLFTEMLEGKHNDFLQVIIDRSKEE